MGRNLHGEACSSSQRALSLSLRQYTEFTSYAALLSGAPPSVLQRSLVAQHRQTVKLYEWHLLEEEDPVGPRSVRPLMAGNPCRAYVPDDLTVHEAGDTLELTEPGATEPIAYQSWASIKRDGTEGKVRDIILTGQVSSDTLPTLPRKRPYHPSLRRVIPRGASLVSSAE